ncbi:MAG: hypothetical protein NDI94_03450 [Candidatus Woesearchaeota archaeon]|nr:hypothetical protein [Candidatus Woesearchaeota archaeon]
MDIGNIRSVMVKWKYLLIFFLSTVLIIFIMFKYTYFEETYYNIGAWYIYSQTALQMMLAVLFGLNVSLLWHKLDYSSQFAKKEAHTTAAASVMGVIVSGCPTCGITLASYLGLASFFSALPFFGMELKVLGIGLLLYSINSLSDKMYVCETGIVTSRKA